MLTHIYESGWQSVQAPLHSYSVTCAHAHIRVGPAFNACPSSLVFSDWCSRTYTSWATNHCMPLYTRIQSLVLTHIYELGWQSMPAPLRSSSVSRAHAHIRVGLAISAGLPTLVFSDLCSRTHTSWARIQCLPLYTRIQCLVLTHIYELGWQSLHAPLHSYSVTCVHAHIRVGLAINTGPSTLVFSDLCSRTYTSWARI